MDVEGLYSLLLSAVINQDPHIQKQSLEQLSGCHQVEGFVEALVTVIPFTASETYALNASEEVQKQVRILAAITLKNVVNRCWTQKGGHNHNNNNNNGDSNEIRFLDEREKEGLKSFVLQYIEEPDQKVSIHLASLTARIARFEWPQGWPDLLNNLFSIVTTQQIIQIEDVQEQEHLREVRALSTLNEVFEELSTKKLPWDKKSFEAMCLETFPFISAVFTNIGEVLMAKMTSFQDNINEGHLPIDMARDAYFESLGNHQCKLLLLISKCMEKYFAVIANTDQDALGSFLTKFMSQLQSYLQFLRSMNAFIHRTERHGNNNNNNNNNHHTVYDIEKEIDEEENTLIFSSNMYVQTGGNLGALKAILPFIRRLVRDMAKLLMLMQKDNPIEICAYLEPLLQMFRYQLSEEFSHEAASYYGNISSARPFCIYAVMFISNTLSCRVYESAISSDPQQVAVSMMKGGEGNEMHGSNNEVEKVTLLLKQAVIVLHDFFATPATNMQQMLDMTLKVLLNYSQNELQMWIEDPEQFVVSQSGQSEEDSLRSAAEYLVLGFLDYKSLSATCAIYLFEHLRDLVVQGVMNQSIDNDNNGNNGNDGVGNHNNQQQVGITSPSDEDLMFWDNILLSIGLGSPVVGQHVSGNEMLSDMILPMMETLIRVRQAGNLSCGAQLLCYRLVWFVRCWFYHFDTSLHESILAMIIGMLEPSHGSDVVVLMETVQLIETALDQGFQSDMLATRLIELMQGIARVATSLEDGDLQGTVVKVISKLIITMDAHLVPMLEQLTMLFVSLWDQSEQSSPIRPALLDALTQMVKATSSSGGISLEIQSMLLPIVAYALSGLEESTADYLSKEGVLLWLTILRNSHTGYTDGLDEVLPIALDGLFNRQGLSDGEITHLCNIMRVCESYAIIGGKDCLMKHATIFHQVFTKLIGEVAPKAVSFVMRPFEAFFLTCAPEIIMFLEQSELLVAILKPCLAAMTNLPLLVHHLEKKKEMELAMIPYLTLIARIILVNPSSIMTGITSILQEIDFTEMKANGIDENIVVKELVGMMLDKFDQVGYSEAGMWRRRLWCLALLSLYPSQVAVYDGFSQVFHIASLVIAEQCSSEGKAEILTLPSLMLLGDEGKNNRHDLLSSFSLDDFDLINEYENSPRGADITGSEPALAPLVQSYTALLQQDCVLNNPLEATVEQTCNAMRDALGDEKFTSLIN